MSASASKIVNFIGGAFVEPRSGEFLDDLNPATDQIIAKIARSGAADVHAAVAAAQEAFPLWSAVPLEERAVACDAIADGLEARLDDLARLESLDTGKPVALARALDIPRAVANFRFFAQAARQSFTRAHLTETRAAHALNYSIRRPLGVVALITPWNLPLYLLSWKVAPALLMGNTVVAKPSEFTPLTANALVEVWAEVARKRGLPAAALNLIHGTGLEAGAPLTGHSSVRAVSFTGGTATGARVAESAAAQFKKLSLELGGKNPTVVFADCDFDAAVRGVARAAFLNQGEICLCGSRIFVEKKIYDRFEAAFVAEARKWVPGDPLHPDTRVGALISKAHWEKVEGYVNLAKSEGGTIACGGRSPQMGAPFDQGSFFEPTVITGLAPGCRTASEEIFGPVVTLHSFEGESQVLGFCNASRYGLSASVWTRDLARAHRFGQQLDAGVIWVNTWLSRDLRTPFGGVKDSGVGREGGEYSLDFFSEIKNICIDLGGSQ